MKVRESIVDEILDDQLVLLLGGPDKLISRIAKEIDEMEDEMDKTNPFILRFIKSNLGASVETLHMGVKLGCHDEVITQTLALLALSWLQVVRAFDKEEEIRKLDGLIKD